MTKIADKNEIVTASDRGRRRIDSKSINKLMTPRKPRIAWVFSANGFRIEGFLTPKTKIKQGSVAKAKRKNKICSDGTV